MAGKPFGNGSVYTATFNAVAVSAAQDVFEIVAPSTSRVIIRSVQLGQYSDAGDSAAELLSVLFIRGYTVTGSGGAAVTAASAHGLHTAGSTIARNNTTVANTGTVQTLIAEAWNVQAPYIHLPDESERIWLAVSQRLVIRITAPADAITMNGTLTFEEAGA